MITYAIVLSLATLLSTIKAKYIIDSHCVLQLPSDPLSAEGLATPFLLTRNSCDQKDPVQRVYAEATVFDPSTNHFAVYHPLVINQDTRPAVNPVAPVLPKQAVVILKFATQANSLTLTGNTRSCFTTSNQTASCNAAAFFRSTTAATGAWPNKVSAHGLLTKSPACAPSSELKSLVFTTYLENANGELAQSTLKNQRVMARYRQLRQPQSANISPPPRCSSWMAASLMEPNVQLPSSALYDLHSAHKHRQSSSTPPPPYSSSSSSSRSSVGLHRQFRRDGHLKVCSNRGELGEPDGTVPGADICVPVPRNITDNETLETPWGPLTAADRDLIRKVRLASLWELPMAAEARTRSQNHKVRRISLKIQEQHEYLDAAVLAMSKQLDGLVTLPTAPSSEQACWMCEIRAAASDTEYNALFVKRLRFAHGQIFATIATVRSTTRNTAVRAFAETANLFVLGHMQMLESTGLTDAASFPIPPPVNLVK